MRYATILALTLFVGCGDLTGGGSDVSGTVNGKTFTSVSGSAESSFGSYVITLSDSSEFSCTANTGLPDVYLTVVIGDVLEAPATFDASGVVGFNSFESGIGTPESAISGTVTIDEIDEAFGTIDGSIDASGASSNVSGTFSVEICN